MVVKRHPNGSKSIARPVVGCAASIFAVCCSPFVIMAIAELIDGSAKKVGVSIAMGVLFAFGTVGGGALAYKMFKTPKINPAIIESMVLQLAADNGAKLTVSELAMRSPLDLDKARAVLGEMVTKRAAEVLVDENGAEVFHFVELGGQKQLKS